LQGKEAWNAWAEKMLAGRKAMEADGRWTAEEEKWIEESRADFSRCLFSKRQREKQRRMMAQPELLSNRFPLMKMRSISAASFFPARGCPKRSVSWEEDRFPGAGPAYEP
jgi:hypothetical protein